MSFRGPAAWAHPVGTGSTRICVVRGAVVAGTCGRRATGPVLLVVLVVGCLVAFVWSLVAALRSRALDRARARLEDAE